MADATITVTEGKAVVVLNGDLGGELLREAIITQRETQEAIEAAIAAGGDAAVAGALAGQAAGADAAEAVLINKANKTGDNITGSDAQAFRDNLRLDTTVWPELFGAVGNGMTDDTTAVLAALAAARSLGVPLTFKSFYGMSASIVLLPNDRIYGSGRGVSGLKYASAGNFNMLEGNAAHRADVRGFSTYGRREGSGSNIYLTNTVGAKIDIAAYDNGGLGYWLIDCDACELFNPQFGASTDTVFATKAPWGIILDGSGTCQIYDPQGERCGFGISIIGDDTNRVEYVEADPATDSVTVTTAMYNGAVTGDTAVFSTTGTLPAPLVAGTTYYVIKGASPLLKFATSHANAVAGTAIDITSAGAGQHMLTLTYRETTITADPASDEITVSAAIYGVVATGDPVTFRQAQPFPAPLAANVTYYIIKTVTSNVIKLATSNANAIAGTAINITAAETGPVTMTLGTVNSITQNDHRSIRPRQATAGNRVWGGRLYRWRGHPCNLNSVYDTKFIGTVAEKSEEYNSGVLVDRVAFQIKHSSGDECQLSGFYQCYAKNVPTGFGAQEGRYGQVIDCSVDGAEFDGVRFNSHPDAQCRGLRAKGVKGRVMRSMGNSPRCSFDGFNVEAHSGGTSILVDIDNSTGCIIGAGRHTGTFASAITISSNSGEFDILPGFKTNSQPVFISAEGGRYPITATADLDMSVTGIRSVSQAWRGAHLCRVREIAFTAASGQIRVGRINGVTAFMSAHAVPTAIQTASITLQPNITGMEWFQNTGQGWLVDVSTAGTGRMSVELSGIPTL